MFRTLAGAAALSIVVVMPAAAQSGFSVSLEGGLACSKGEKVISVPGATLGSRGCGSTGAAEIGATGKPVFAIFDHWAVRGRLTRVNDKQDDFSSGGITTNSTFDDRRFVLDAELGTKLPFGLFGSSSRLTLGVRYADYTGAQTTRVTAGLGAGSIVTSTSEWSGIGPRIGLRSTLPLGTHWMIESRSGAAALFGDHETRIASNGSTSTTYKNAGTVYSLESSMALAYKFNGTDAGPVVSVGLLSEYWFQQIDVKSTGARIDRHSFGPFARVRLALP